MPLNFASFDRFKHPPMAIHAPTPGIGNQPADRQFSRDIEQFISRHWQPGGEPRAWFDALQQRGWLAPDWPRQYGGTGWSRPQQWRWLQATRGCPMPDARFRVIAPLLRGVGTQQQREQYLPGILDRTSHWGIAAATRETLETTADGWRLTGSLGHATPSDATNFCLLLPDPEPSLDMTLLLLDLRHMPVSAGAGDLAVKECSLDFNETFISRNSLLGSPGKGRQHLATCQSCYLILMEQYLSAANIASALRHEKSQPDAALTQRLAQFRINLDAMLAMFLRGNRDPLLRLYSVDLSTRAIGLLQDAIGYYALLNPDEILEAPVPGSLSTNSRLAQNKLLKSNEPPLPFETERQHLAALQGHPGQLADPYRFCQRQH